MSYLYAHVWVVGTPKCSSACCDRLILDYSQAVVVVSGQGSVGFCSLDCFQASFGPAAVAEQPKEETEDRDLLLALGYSYPAEENDPA
jgi:hypothetical protein